MTNRIIIIGRITKNLELKTVKSGKSLTNFSIAVSPKQGEVYFFDCVAWGALAENICKYLKKGSQIAVDGQLTTNSYQNKSGTNITKVIISVNSAEFLGTSDVKKKPEVEEPYEPEDLYDEEPATDDKLPF